MPIYEFGCHQCGARFSLFFRTVASAGGGACPSCGGSEIERVVSRVAVLKGDRGRADAIDPGQLMGGLDDRDVGSFARWARKVGTEYDAELGTNYRELAERADAGDDPVERIDAGYSLNYHVEKRRAEAESPAADPRACLMPIYEYRCQTCKKRVSVFQRSITVAASAACDRCGGKDLTRLVSKFAVVRTEDDFLGDMSDDAGMMDFDESDPKAMARWARKMRDEMGEEGGPAFDDMVDRLEAGEDVDSVMAGAGDDDDGGFGGLEEF